MSIVPSPDNQQFSEKTLKGFLLKNVDPTVSDPALVELNKYLQERVDRFWDSVIVPLKNAGKFNGNKIMWYFELYKEGLDAHRIIEYPFRFIDITNKTIEDIVEHFKGKTIVQYCEMGTSFLSNTFSILSFWHRDNMVLERLKKIYVSPDPVDWIYAAEEEERGLMSEKKEFIPGVLLVINNITLILGKRV